MAIDLKLKAKTMHYKIIFLLISLQLPLLAQDSGSQNLEQEIKKNIELSNQYYSNHEYDLAIEAANDAYVAAIKANQLEYQALALNLQAWAWAQKKNKKFAFQTIQKSQKLIRKNNIQNQELKNSNKQLLLQITGISELKGNIVTVTKAVEEAIENQMEDLKQMKITLEQEKTDSNALTSVEEGLKTNELLSEKPRIDPVVAPEKIKIPAIKLPELSQVPTQSEITAIVKKSFDEINEKAIIEKKLFVEEMEAEEEKIEDLDAEEAKQELLYAHYKLKLDSLNNLHMMDSLNLVAAEANLLKSNSELRRQKTIRLLNIVGAGGSILLISLLLFGYRRQKKSNQMLSEKNRQILEEQGRSEELLLNILPAKVADELKENGTAKAHKYENVSVLFSDFQNFSKIAEKLPPEKLVSELDYCFKAFDNIIGKYELEKIKTIGDAYMCAGGLPSPNNQNANLAVKAALEIQEFLHNLKSEKIKNNEPYFEARIGIHTGPIVAGVVGIKKFAYDIWGDTVNIASRMESNSIPGKVNISQTTFKQVKNDFHCSYRGKINAKNKGEIDMYFVEEIKELAPL